MSAISRPTSSVAQTAAGTAWLAAACVYLTTETLAARQFSPTYSYQRNFISELGVPQCVRTAAGRFTCSPLHELMNLGFIFEGVLFVVAAALVAPRLRSRSRYAFGLAGAAHGAGLVLVGLFHAAGADALDGRTAYHALGATLAIFGGDAAIALSPVAKDLAGPRWLQTIGKLAGLVGLAAAVIFSITVARQRIFMLDYAVWERLSVYTILVWEAVTGLWLLVSSSRSLRPAAPQIRRRH